jgi:hypothetical protein
VAISGGTPLDSEFLTLISDGSFTKPKPDSCSASLSLPRLLTSAADRMQGLHLRSMAFSRELVAELPSLLVSFLVSGEDRVVPVYASGTQVSISSRFGVFASVPFVTDSVTQRAGD